MNKAKTTSQSNSKNKGSNPVKPQGFSSDIVVGGSIGGYQLDQLLSSNTKNRTFKATKGAKQYALKVIAAEFGRIGKRQINMLMKLKNCTFFTKIEDSFEHKGSFCFVTEFVESISLFEYIRSKPDKRINPEEALVIFRSILSGLIEMHSIKVLHRNLKIENILLTKDMVPIICGFGLSCELDSDQMTWSLCGTPSYLAPEILQGQMYDYKMDIWAMGVLLFAMTTGQLPFGSHSTLKSQWTHIRLATTPTFSFSNVKAQGIKYPDRVNFGENSKSWESLFRGFFDERPSKRFTYVALLNHELISPILKADLPKMYDQDYSKLDDILSSVVFKGEEVDYDNINGSDDNSDDDDQTDTRSEGQVKQMAESTMLASAANFICNDYSNHLKFYKFEIERYLVIADVFRYLNDSKGFMLAVPREERFLVSYFLAQRLLYFARWLAHLMEKRINHFKLDNFEKFTASKTYKDMLVKIQGDCKQFEQLMIEQHAQIKAEKADEKLPESITSSITEYIFIDFNKEDYLDLPPQFKLPYRAILTQTFARVFAKSQRFLSYDEKLLSNVEGHATMSRDKKRQYCVDEARSLLRIALRLLVSSLINRALINRKSALTEIHATLRSGEFDLTTFLNSMTVATQRQSSTTIQMLFSMHFPHIKLSEIAKQKFF